jgi:hypothetical protein
MNLLNLPITAAIGVTVTVPLKLNAAARNIAVQANFTFGSGGASVNAYLQTTLDGGATWIDIAQFNFAAASARFVYNLNAQTPVPTEYTATDGTLGANTAKDGILGAQFRVKYVTTGTYVGTTLSIDVSTDQVA